MPGPGDTYYGEFTTSNPTTGALQTADSLPTLLATQNGIDDVAFTFTVTLGSTGRYKYVGTIPITYLFGDSIQISALATVSGIAGGGIVASFILVEPTLRQINNFPFFMALSTDGRSPAIGKTVIATRNIDGGGFQLCASPVSETGGGWYEIDLTTDDLNFTDSVALDFSATGCDSTLFTILAG